MFTEKLCRARGIGLLRNGRRLPCFQGGGALFFLIGTTFRAGRAW